MSTQTAILYSEVSHIGGERLMQRLSVAIAIREALAKQREDLDRKIAELDEVIQAALEGARSEEGLK